MTAVLCISYFFYVLLPLFFISKIWRNCSVDFLNWGMWTVGAGVYIGYLFCVGVWPIIVVGYYFRYVLLVGYVAASIKSFFRCNRHCVSMTRGRFVTLSIVGIVCLIQIGTIVAVYISSLRFPEGIELDFPLQNGEYYIGQGGNNPITNHHYEISAQKYAVDILKLNGLGLRCNQLNPCFLEHFNIFGDVLYSPCDGKIVDLVDGHPDLELGIMDEEHPAGNYLVIEMHGSNVLVVLAHIQKGSYFIENGSIVKKGQLLAKVGNSGNTSEPHLHMHAVMNKTGDVLFAGQGIPMKFNDRFLIRNDRI